MMYPNNTQGFLNRIAARVLDALIDRVPMYPTDQLGAVTPRECVWGHTIMDAADGEPYMTRVLFPRLLGGARPVLHRFYRADGDDAVHNHPWSGD